MPRLRPDPEHCHKGHDLTLPGATWVRADGFEECKACTRGHMVAWRTRRRNGQPPRKRARPTRDIPLANLNNRLQKMVDDETLPAYLKPRRKRFPPDSGSRTR